jgi:hypothetical protein
MSSWPDSPSDLIGDVTATLQDIDRTGEIPSTVEENPGAFFVRFYDAWYANGGREGGKPRNSIRRMRNEWLVDGKAVPSLHPKLTGQVKIGRRDGQQLIELFLSRWEYVGSRRKDEEVTSDGYLPFPSENPKHLVELLATSIFGPAERRSGAGILLPTARDDEEEGGLDAESVRSVMSLMRDADSSISVSSRNTVIGPTPAEGMRLWWHVMEDFFRDEAARSRLLIWVIDLGSRQVEDEGAFEDYLNAGSLALHFAAFANFSSAHDQEETGIGPIGLRLSIADDQKRLDRWRWILEHAAIVVRVRGNRDLEAMYAEEDAPLKAMRLQDIGLSAEHLLPRTVPYGWAKALEGFYQTAIEDLAEASLLVTHKKSGGESTDLHYLAVAQSTNGTSHTVPQDDASSFIATDLPSPGRDYDDAFRLVHLAASYRLASRDSKPDEQIAMAFLQSLGFQVLRLNDFIKTFSLVEGLT